MKTRDQWPARMPTPGSDRGFLIRYAAGLVGLGIIYVFREEITWLAAHPQSARRMVEAFVARATELGTAFLPVVALLLLAGVAAALLVVRLRARPMAVPRLRLGERRIRIGRIRGSRRTYDVPKAGIFDHWLILGRSRFGKSRHAAGLARQYLDSGLTGLTLIDPHDELCRSFVAASGRSLQDRPITWVSFGHDDVCPGLNILERLPGESPSQVAGRFVSLVDWLYFGGESVDHQKCTNNLRLAAWAVSSVGGLLPDCRLFLTSPRYRAWLTTQIRDRFLRQAISEYNWNASHDPGWPQSALNRLADLLDNEPLRRIVCQETTFDLTPALDRKGVLLVSLDGSVLGEKGVFLLAGLLLHQIAARLKQRPKDDGFHENAKVRLMLDEAQSFEVGILKQMIGELAGRGLALTLMTQGLTQFSDPRLFSYVTNNFGTYSVFAVSDEEAQPLAHQLFAPGANRVGMVDEYGRPTHYLSIPEQVAESVASLTQQARREFVAKAYDRPTTLCESFELIPQIGGEEVEAFRQRELERLGRPVEEIDRSLQSRMQTLLDLRAPASGESSANAGDGQSDQEEAGVDQGPRRLRPGSGPNRSARRQRRERDWNDEPDTSSQAPNDSPSDPEQEQPR